MVALFVIAILVAALPASVGLANLHLRALLLGLALAPAIAIAGLFHLPTGIVLWLGAWGAGFALVMRRAGDPLLMPGGRAWA